MITPIDYDHEAFLGRSIEAIAGEKAGIIKPGVPVVIGPQRPSVEALLAARAAELGAPVSKVSEWTVEDLQLDARGSRFVAAGPRRVNMECPLAGEHQVSNALTAIAALHVLGVPTAAVEEGIRRRAGRAVWSASRESPRSSWMAPTTRPAPWRWLGYIQRFYAGRRVWLVYGAMRDKAVSEVASLLFPLAHNVILTAPANARAVRPEVVRTLVNHPSVQVAGAWLELWHCSGKLRPAMPSSSPARCSWWAKPGPCSYNRLLCRSSARISSSTR